MDYTKQEIRPLIYQNKEDIDQFDINDATALDAEMLRRIENSIIADFDGANKYILDIFNNAYYITTLIMMEKHPIHFFKKYIIIAEHTSSAYNDIYQTNTLYQYFSAMVMAMVCNYLRLLDEYYTFENILIRKIMYYFEGVTDMTLLLGPYSIFSKNTLDINELNTYHINKKSFEPRIVDAQAVYETNSKLNGMQKGWRGLTNDYNHKDIVELLSICQDTDGKVVMADTIRREAAGYRCDKIVDFIDSLDLKLTIDIDAATKNADVALLRRYCLLLTEQNSALAKQIPNQLTDGLTYEKEDNNRVKELEEQIEELQQRLIEKTGEQRWIACFEGFLHENLNAQAIAQAINNINSPKLPKKERGYWWAFYTVLTEINWIPNKNHKMALQWANLHFDCGWDWTQKNQFKFSEIAPEVTTVSSYDWNENTMKTIAGKYYGELAKKFRDTFVEIIEDKMFDRKEFIKQGCRRINDGH